MAKMEDKTSDDTSTWLDKEFVQTLLRDNEKDDSIVVKEITVRPAAGKGDNYGSQVHRIAVDFTAGGTSSHLFLITKSVTAALKKTKFVNEGKIFERERRMYMETLPDLYKLQQEHSPDAKIQTLSPRAYKTSRPHTIVMEDLSTQGYKMAERHRGLDFQHTKLALRALARLHALSIALLSLDPKRVERHPEPLYTEKTRDLNTEFIEPTIQLLAHSVEQWSGFERFGEMIRNIPWVEKTMELVKVKPGGIIVLNHGDILTNNLLFKYSDVGMPESVRLLDFQLSRYSSPAMDIHYFMYTSPTEEVREKCWDEVIREYHLALIETLRSIGCEEKGFSLEKLKEELDERRLFGLLTACSILPILLVDPENAPQLTELTTEKKSLGNMDKMFCGDRYRQVMEKILLFFENNGTFALGN